MKKLVTVTSKSIKEKLKNNDIEWLYPLDFFCVGYETTFKIDEIDGYCLVNRLLNDEELDTLDKLLHKSNIKGIMFDDLGIIEITKDLSIKKILLLDHLSNNQKSINYYLDYVDSVVVSNDLTKEEIIYIAKNAKKEVIVNVFGLKTLMYSRRLLLSNYQEFYNLKKEPVKTTSIESKDFMIVESPMGTKFYAYPYYNALELLNLDNVLFYWYDPIFLSDELIINVLLNNDLSNIKNSKIFLDQKTIFKVGDIDA